APSDLQLGDVVGGEVPVPGGLDGLAGGVRAVDDHGHRGDVRTGLGEGLAGGEHAAAGGGGVLDRDHATAGDVRSLDAALQPVGLVGLAHHEGVQGGGRPVGRGGVQDRGGHRV